MESISNDFVEVLLWSMWLFIWIGALFIWIRCLFDLFGDGSLSGWAKAAWAVLLVLVPWIGALIYLIARGRSMNQRRLESVAQQRAEQERYIREVATSSQSPADQIASAKALFDSQTITQSEYDVLKARALA